MKRVRPTVLLLLVLLLATVATGCASTPSAGTNPDQEATGPSADVPVIVFDMGHGEIFGAEDTTELGQSKAVGRMQAAGFDVRINADEITEADLANAAGLVLPGPMAPLNGDEYRAINSFVSRGGTVLLTIHVPFPVMAVPSHWGLPVTPGVMLSESALAPNDPGVFVASDVTASPVTEGVSDLIVVSGWPVRAAAQDTQLVLSTADDVWIDSDNDGVRTDADEVGPFGVVGVARLGQGQVVVIGDDAVFANIVIDEADNGRLLDNILELMKDAEGV